MQIYDDSLDSEHTSSDFVYTNLGVQRYFAPVISGKQVLDSIGKLKKTFDQNSKKLNNQLLKIGATYAPK